MYNFIFNHRPASFNSWVKSSGKGKAYKSIIENSFKAYNKDYNELTGELYGTVFHFFRKDLKIDVDNLSKPIWDCLEELLYKDDFQVKIRIAGNFDLTNKNNLKILDFSTLNNEVIEKLLEAFENEEHIVYVECGDLNYSMYKFNVGSYGN